MSGTGIPPTADFVLSIRLILLILSLPFFCAVPLRLLFENLLHDAAGGLPFLCHLAKPAVLGVILLPALQDFGVFHIQFLHFGSAAFSVNRFIFIKGLPGRAVKGEKLAVCFKEILVIAGALRA